LHLISTFEKRGYVVLIKKQVKVKWNGMTRKHYESFGYEYTKKDEEFWVCTSELTRGSNIVVAFTCDYCGVLSSRQYTTLMRARRIIEKDTCTGCESKKHYETLLINKGSLESEYPLISKDWCYKSNVLTPDKITPYSGKKAIWLCVGGHSWEAAIYSRTLDGTGCPKCTLSKGEMYVASSLYVLDVDYKTEHSFHDLIGTGGGPLRFDFALLDRFGEVKALIEYDGAFHYDKQFEGDGHEQLVIHDRRKLAYCPIVYS